MSTPIIRSLSHAVELHIRGEITTEQFQAFRDNQCSDCGEAAAVASADGRARCAGCEVLENG